MAQLIRKDGLFLTTASIPFKNQDKEESIKLVVDTGAALTIVDTVIMDYLGYSAKEDGLKKSTLDGAGGRSVGYLIKVKQFKCLDFELENFEIACHDMNTRLGVAGILGMNFLRHFRIDVDFNTGLIHKIEKVI